MAAAGPAPEPRPWTLEGDYDPAYDDDQRELYHRLLTDPHLAGEFRRRFPLRRRTEYEGMVRALGAVWDCPVDGTANVTGYCCATCRQPRPRTQGP